MKIDNLVRENIKKLNPYTSARSEYLNGILLDANENSFGSVLENNLELNRYPDPNHNLMKRKLTGILDVSSDNIFIGSGSDEIIDLTIRIFCSPGNDNVIIPIPTYGMYKVSCNISDIKVQEINLTNEFQPDVNKILTACDKNTKVIFLCSPNNPTGNIINRELILKLLEKFNGIIFIDEAYIDFDEENTVIDLVNEYSNIIVSRTFSKAWGLAGIRAGYCASGKEIINYFYKIKSPYNLNKLTESALLNALEKNNKKNDFIRNIVFERERLYSVLSQFRSIQKVINTSANFLLIKVDKSEIVYKRLVDSSIIVRLRDIPPLLDNCLRITIGTPEENDFLIKKLEEILYE